MRERERAKEGSVFFLGAIMTSFLFLFSFSFSFCVGVGVCVCVCRKARKATGRGGGGEEDGFVQTIYAQLKESSYVLC